MKFRERNHRGRTHTRTSFSLCQKSEGRIFPLISFVFVPHGTSALAHSPELSYNVLDSHASVVNNWLSWIAEKRGEQARAMQLGLLNAPLDGWDAKSISLLREAYENRDWKRFCETDLQRLTANKEQPSASYFIAVDELRLGNKEPAFNWLETSLEGKTVWVMWIRVDPLLDDLRSDPRFNQLLRKMRLPA